VRVRENAITVITGGAGGMGLAAARIVGRTQPVVLCDVTEQRLNAAVNELKSAGITAHSHVFDITDRGSVDGLALACTKIGDIGAVIHAAGLSPSMADADTIMKVNAVGTININEVFRQFACDGFAIVNVASMAAYSVPDWAVPERRFRYALADVEVFAKKMKSMCDLAPKKMRPGVSYCLSKRFVVWYTKVTAKDLGRNGARVVSVSPGSIDTAMGRLEEQSGSEAMLQAASLKRFGKPEEVAEVLAFCSSPRAGYLTGVDILVDGGVTAGMTLRTMIAAARRS
jgi:NAD(P)-dependent dehydrogenase (short-subunit alcohol dehydrogenase family)